MAVVVHVLIKKCSMGQSPVLAKARVSALHMLCEFWNKAGNVGAQTGVGIKAVYWWECVAGLIRAVAGRTKGYSYL